MPPFYESKLRAILQSLDYFGGRDGVFAIQLFLNFFQPENAADPRHIVHPYLLEPIPGMGLSSVRPQETLAVEVNQMCACFLHPDFGLPRDFADIFCHFAVGQEGCDENQSCG